MDFKNFIARLRPRHLELLDALGKDPHLGRCAKRMNMSQPASSKALREIEDIFGTPLFERNRRGMAPTPMGVVLTRRAALLIAEMQSMHQEYQAALAGHAGRIRIGLFPVALPVLFPLWQRQITQARPGLAVCATEGTEGTLLAQLAAGQLDCVLGRIVPEALLPGLRHEVLYQEPSAIVCSPGHPARKAKKQRLLQWLSESGWVLPSPDGASFQLLASRLAEAGLPAPRVAIEATSAYLTAEMVNAGPFFSLLPLSVARAFEASGRVHRVPVPLPASHRPVGFLCREEVLASPLVAQALDAARTAARLMAAGSGSTTS